MQNKKNRRQNTENHRRPVRFEDLLEDDRFDDEDADSVTEDTLEFLSLDDDMIESYQRAHPPKSRKSAAVKSRPVRYDDYEDEDYEDEDEDYEDEDYEDEDYEDEDEDYEDEDYEDEDYEDEDYEDYEDEDYEYDDDDGFAARLMYFIGEMSALDVAVALLGILVLAGAIATGGIYLHAKSVEKQVAAFADMGEEIEGISVIGESGLLAASESAKLGGMLDVEEESEEEEEETEQKRDEKEGVEVELHLTSILSDMKIKFVNKETGKLIGGVPFEVDVSGTKSFQLKDDDKDGVIYQTGVAAGTYEVKLLPLPEGAAGKYTLPAKGSSVKVTDKIAYQKVDVADEVKTEAEINVAKEEATQQNTVVESALKDTVEWVESTKTPIGEETAEYEKVPMDKIADPWQTGGAFRKMAEDGEYDPYDNVQVSINKESMTLEKGKSDSLKISVSSSEVEYSVDWSVSDSSIATVDGGTVTGVAAGNTTVTAQVIVDRFRERGFGRSGQRG